MEDGDCAAQGIALRSVHERVSAELLALQKVSLAIENDIHVAFDKSGIRVSTDARRQLQELDRLSQTLGCLGDFLSSTAQALPSDHDLDLRGPLAAVRLRSVADRLAGRPAAPVNDSEGSGIDLFG